MPLQPGCGVLRTAACVRVRVDCCVVVEFWQHQASIHFAQTSCRAPGRKTGCCRGLYTYGTNVPVKRWFGRYQCRMAVTRKCKKPPTQCPLWLCRFSSPDTEKRERNDLIVLDRCWRTLCLCRFRIRVTSCSADAPSRFWKYHDVRENERHACGGLRQSWWGRREGSKEVPTLASDPSAGDQSCP